MSKKIHVTDTSKKVYVIDTNVILYDPKCFKKFGDNIICLLPTVLEEVDGKKKRKDEIGRASREFNREIDSLRELSGNKLHEIYEMSHGGFIFTYAEPISKMARNEMGEIIDLNKNDNKILALTRDLDEMFVDLSVILVTKDCNLRLMADCFGILAEDYQNSQVKEDVVYATHPKIEISPQLMSTFYDGSNDHLDKIGEEFDSVIGQIGLNGFAEVFTKDFGDVAIPVFCGDDNNSKPNLFPINRGKGAAYGIKAKNIEQLFAMYALLDPSIHAVVIDGPSGTGKTLLAMAAALEQTIEGNPRYDRIVISRPTVGMDGEEMGYLPGGAREKMAPWLGPIYDSFKKLLNDASHSDDTFDMYEEKGKIEVQPLQFIRGRSFTRAYIIIDEAQNLTPLQVKTIMTRAGAGTKIVLTGDPDQIDASYLDKTSCGIAHVIAGLRNTKVFARVSLTQTERSVLAELAAKLL